MSRASRELEDALADLETLLKNGEVLAELTERGLNASLAMLAVEALEAYLVAGDRAKAAEDFATVAEEIQARLSAARDAEGGGGGGTFGGKPS